MNQKNVEYLENNLKYLGFGDKLNEELRSKVAEGKLDFTLRHEAEFNGRKLSATLHFRRPEATDLYFLNKWDGKLLSEIGKREQTFYLKNGHGISLKEGFNLLEGRAVHLLLQDREGEKYKAWLQLDLKSQESSGNYRVNQYHQNYGFDLEKALSVFPIKDLQTPEQKHTLIKSLEKGNVQSAVFDKDGFAEKLFVEAAPRFKSINVYDHSGQKLSLETLEKRYGIARPAKSEGELSLIGKAAGKELPDKEAKAITSTREKPGGLKEKPERQKEQSPRKAASQEALLPKKRTSTKKGQQL